MTTAVSPNVVFPAPPLPRPLEPVAVRGAPPPATAAQVLDLAGPLTCDFGPFTEVLERDVRAWPNAPRLYEFGSGAGHVSLSLLAARPDMDYHGFDWSPDLQALHERKVRRLPARLGRTTFTAPCDLTHRALAEPVRGMRADLILLNGFLAQVSAGRLDGQLHQAAFLGLCRQLLKPGGLVFVLEQVRGESAEEDDALMAGWERVAQTRMRERLQSLDQPVRDRDPEFAALLAQVIRDPSRLAVLRRALGVPEPEPLPLSGWQQLFQRVGYRYRTVPHPTLRNYYLFSMRA